MTDPTEDTRREMIESGQPARDAETAQERWTTDELQRDFEVVGFMAPFVLVKRRSDGEMGTLEFTHSPRVYFNWVPDRTDGQIKQLELERAEGTLREQLQREDAGPPLIGDNDLRTCLRAVRQAQGKGWTGP